MRPKQLRMHDRQYVRDANSNLAVFEAGVPAHDGSCQEGNGDEGDSETHAVLVVWKERVRN